jgi:hypothetical protein
MPPEARIGPSESPSTVKLKCHQTWKHWHSRNLRRLLYIRVGPGYPLGQLACIFLYFRAHLLALPLKQTKTEVSGQQFALPGGLDKPCWLRELT